MRGVASVRAGQVGRMTEVAGGAGTIPTYLAELASSFDDDVVVGRAEEQGLDLVGRFVEVAADQIASDGVSELVEVGGLHAV